MTFLSFNLWRQKPHIIIKYKTAKDLI